MKTYFDYINSLYLPIDIHALRKDIGNPDMYQKILDFIFVGRTTKFTKSMKGYITGTHDGTVKGKVFFNGFCHGLTQITSDRSSAITLVPDAVFINENERDITFRKMTDDKHKIDWYAVDVDEPISIKVKKPDIDQINDLISKVKATNQFDL